MISKYLNIFNFSKKRKRHFFINLFFGLIFTTILVFLENNTLKLETPYNQQLDQFIAMKFQQEYKNKQALDDLYFIELNEKTFKDWNSILNPVTPRNKLALLVKDIAKEKPKVIFLDILLDTKSPYDKKLADIIDNILNENNITNFIFPINKEYIYDEIRYPYFRDRFKEKYENRRIFYAIPNISSYGTDTVNRYFEYYDENTKILSVPLTAYLLEENRKDLISNAQSLNEIYVNDNFIDLSQKNKLIDNRIMYYFFKGWVERKNKHDSMVLPLENKHILGAEDNKSILKDKVVFIGTNVPFRGDIHETIIGKMAGIYILGNTYLTIKNPLHPISSCSKFLILSVIIIMLSYLFTWIEINFWRRLFLVGFIGIILFFISYFLFTTQGIFISILIPLIYVQNHINFIDNIKNVYKFIFKKRKKNVT